MYEDDSMQDYNDYHAEQAHDNALEAADYDHEDDDTDEDDDEDYEPHEIDMCDLAFDQ